VTLKRRTSTDGAKIAVRDFGFPMGPFQVSDLAGGIGWSGASARRPRAEAEIEIGSSV
jgi:3-hydroxyacyl-CoA dehydrogenase